MRQLGFMDQEMPGGMQWADELLHAAGTCQVLVALLSAPYLKSEWCGMEWHAFSQRTVTEAGGSAGFPAPGMHYPGAMGAVPLPLCPRTSAQR